MRRAFSWALPALVAGSALTAPSMRASAQATPPPAVVSLSDCVQRGGRLSVVLLIDESGSLRGFGGQPGTDPDDQRVAGVKAALTGLTRLAEDEIDGAKPRVEVLLAGFSSEFESAPSFDPDSSDGFRRVSRDSLPSLLGLADVFADRDRGAETDYLAALAGARTALQTRAAELTADGGAPPCRALVFFTDGKYDVEGGQSELASGRAALCEQGGLADAMRRDGVTTFTVALSTNLDDAALTFLRELTHGGNGACGATGSDSTGLFLSVADRDRLIFLFGDLFNPSPPEQRRPGTVCVAEPCTTGVARFEAVPGLSRFLLRATTGGDGVVVRLTPPKGSPVMLRPTSPVSVTVGSANVVQRWISSRSVEVEGAFPSTGDAWIGEWTITFFDEGKEHPNAEPVYTLQLFADLKPSLVGDPKLTIGEPSSLTLRLVDPAGQPLTAGPLLEGARVRANIVDPRTQKPVALTLSGPDDRGRYAGSFTAPAEAKASSYLLEVEAAFPDARAIEIATARRVLTIETQLPEVFPQVTPSELRLPSITGEGDTSGTLTITGSDLVGGCAWVDVGDVGGPDQAGDIVASAFPESTSPASCARIEPREQHTLDLSFAPEKEAEGTVESTVTVHLTSDSSQREAAVDIPVTFELALKPNVARRIWILVGLTALGILLPLLILHLLNRAGAKFPAPQRLRSRSFDVAVLPGQGVVFTDGEPDAIDDPMTFALLDPEGRAHAERSLGLDEGTVTLTTVASGSWSDREFTLLTGPYGRASAARPLLAGSSRRAHLRSWPGSNAHEVPLGLRGTWVFLPDAPALDAGPDGTTWEDADDLSPADGGMAVGVGGRLTLVIADGGGVEQGPALLEEARAALPAAATQLPRIPRDGEPSWLRQQIARLRSIIPERRPMTIHQDEEHDRASDEEGDKDVGHHI